MIRYSVNKDLCEATSDVIAHCVNCQGSHGAGVAKALTLKFPNSFMVYEKKCREEGSKALGECVVSETVEGIQIAHLFGQEYYGSSGRKYVDEEALVRAVETLIDYMKEEGLHTVSMPARIGCGLAGGDWNSIRPVIEKLFIRPDLHLEWCEYGLVV